MAKRSKKKKRKEPETTRVVEPKIEMGEAADSKPSSANRKLILVQAMIIVAAGLWVFWPALGGDWLWDDDRFITDNFQLRSLSGLWDIWFAPGSQIEYYPLEQTVLWVEWQLWHNKTLGYHIVTLVLHVCSALLVWRLLGRLGLRLAWLGGLLFAIHPVQVESAAWMAELKNTLSLPPLLLAMCCYLDYEERTKTSDYLLALALFGVALLCKLTVVMFPVVILLYAWWKRDRIGWNDIKVSAPFFVLSLAVGLITVLSGVWDIQFNDLPHDYLPTGGFAARLALAGQEIAFYFSKSVLPVGLLPVYPKWAVDPASPLHYLPWLVLGGVIGWFWTKRRSWGRHALLGLGFFLINLAPCPGFIPAPNMGYAWVMDHFLYLPIIGLIGLVVAVLGQAEERLAPSFRPVGVGAVVLVMILLGWESRGYAGLYINPETLWTYTLQRNPEAWPAYNVLGYALLQKGRMDEAITQFQKAAEIAPNEVEAYNYLGLAFAQKGQMDEAITQFQKAVEIVPNYVDAHNNLGNALLKKGQVDEAIVQCQKALEINPNFAEARINLGNALLQKGQVDDAIAQFQKALKIKPDYDIADYNLGNALVQKGQVDEAMVQYQKALEIDPNYADAHCNLGNALFQKGRVDEAMAQFQKAVEINPNNVDARYNLGNSLLHAGRYSEAIEQYGQVLKIQPNYPKAHNNLAIALGQMERIPEAIEQFKAELQLHPNDTDTRHNLAEVEKLQKTVPVKP